MSKLKRLLSKRRTWFVIVPLLAVALLILLIVGDPLAGSVLQRFKGVIMGMLLLPVIGILYSYIQMIIDDQVHRRVSGLLHDDGEPGGTHGSQAPQADPAAADDELATISENLKSALATLRKRGLGPRRRRRLYQLPWYAVIGPSGSGKTTAILNSGLRFPLAGRHGAAPLRGVGGTRHCDWWFTDDAVLIDTAGRYTTQEEPTGPERGAWLGFLRLLRKHRRREPVNGILVMIGLDLIVGPASTRHDHAMRVRERVRELYDELGLRIPVYVVISKLDLVNGFVDFFDILGKEGREAVWGMTFDLPNAGRNAAPASPCEAFRTEFDMLVDRLDDQLVDRMQRESDGQRRGRIFGFPQRVASLRDMVAEFLDDTFLPNSYEDPILLRGVYLSSGTQTPQQPDGLRRIDPLAHPGQSIAAANKVLEVTSETGAETSSVRSYFLHRLLREVIFHEAGLVAADPAKSRRRRRGTALGHAVIALAALALCASIAAGYFRNSAAATELAETLRQVSGDTAALAPERVEEPALQLALPLLDRLRAAREKAGRERWGQPLFDPGHGLSGSAGKAYAHALHKLLLPRLVLAAEQAMQRDGDDPAALYQALKVYLILGGRGPLQPDTVTQWAAREALVTLPGKENAALRDALDMHVAALLRSRFETFPLDDRRIAEARAALPEREAAARVLDRIVQGEAAQALPAWQLVENAGPEANSLFADRRGDIGAAIVPGIYTRTGFHTVFLPRLNEVASAEARDLWVLEDQPERSGANTARLTAELGTDATELYLREASLRWDETLSAITIRPLSTLGDALQVMNTLSSPSSPIRILLASIASQTAFDRPLPAAPGKGSEAEGNQPPVDPLAGDPVAQQARERAATFATAHFREIRSLIEVPGNSQQGAEPPIDQVITDLRMLYRQLRDVQSASLAGPLDDTAEALLVLRQVTVNSTRLPEPVRSWITDISASSVDRQTTSARELLNRRWQEGPAALCREVTGGHYPFSAGARTEADLNRFGVLFGPDGAIERFTRDNLDNIIDRSDTGWRWRDVEGIGGALEPEALAAMEQAARIRETMFAGSGQRPSIDFQLSLAELEPSRASVRVVMNGENVEMTPGQTRSLRLHWPSPDGMGRASVSFPQFLSNREPGFAATGNWALYRLIDQAGSTAGRSESGALHLRFQVGDRIAGFVLQADTAANPLDRNLLSDFHCPESF